MNRKRFLGICLIFLMVAFILIQPAYAGPGGQIAKTIARTFWGKMAMGLLTLNLMPIGIYLYFKQRMAERQAVKDLKRMSQDNSNFEWWRVKARIIDCFYRVHNAWIEENVIEACEYMTDWYWQNQQLVRLDSWHREDLRNVCEVRKIRKVHPLLFIHRNDGSAHEGSVLVVSITANMQDYQVQCETGAAVEGHRKFKNKETIWTFSLTEGQWKVSNIEEAGCEFDYIFQVKDVSGIKDAHPGHMYPMMAHGQQLKANRRITEVAASR